MKVAQEQLEKDDDEKKVIFFHFLIDRRAHKHKYMQMIHIVSFICVVYIWSQLPHMTMFLLVSCDFLCYT